MNSLCIKEIIKLHVQWMLAAHTCSFKMLCFLSCISSIIGQTNKLFKFPFKPTIYKIISKNRGQNVSVKMKTYLSHFSVFVQSQSSFLLLFWPMNLLQYCKILPTNMLDNSRNNYLKSIFTQTVKQEQKEDLGNVRKAFSFIYPKVENLM